MIHLSTNVVSKLMLQHQSLLQHHREAENVVEIPLATIAELRKPKRSFESREG